jgi:hypothetical protein
MLKVIMSQVEFISIAILLTCFVKGFTVFLTLATVASASHPQGGDMTEVSSAHTPRPTSPVSPAQASEQSLDPEVVVAFKEARARLTHKLKSKGYPEPIITFAILYLEDMFYGNDKPGCRPPAVVSNYLRRVLREAQTKFAMAVILHRLTSQLPGMQATWFPATYQSCEEFHTSNPRPQAKTQTIEQSPI